MPSTPSDTCVVHAIPPKAIARLNRERTIPLSRYEEEGCIDRFGYLKSLADEHGVAFDELLAIADALGPNEDFDGLVTTLEDFAEIGL
jgi:hypothetical protein